MSAAIALVLLLSALSGTAQAFVVDLNIDPRPIGEVDGRAASQVELPSAVLAAEDSLRLLGRRGGSLRSVAGFSCFVSMADGTGTLAGSLDQCGRLYSLPPGGYADFVRQIPPAEATVLRLAVAPADPGGSIIIGNQGELLLGGDLGPVIAAAAWIDTRWYPVEVDSVSRKVSLDLEGQLAVQAWLQGGVTDLVIRVEQEGAAREREWRAARLWMSQAEREAIARVEEEESREWCEPTLRPADHQRTVMVCVTAEGGELRTRRFEADGTVLEDISAMPTGSFIELAVRHPTSQPVFLALRTDDRPEVRPLDDAGPVPRKNTHRLFALPEGDRVVAVATVGDSVVGAHSFDIVDRYWAAVRLGAAITTPANRSYQPGDENEAGTAAIERGKGDIVDAELLVAFAPFLDREGRDYLLPADWRVAPSIGLGLLSANASTVRFTLLQSWYLGAELELTPAFSVGLAATLRRVKRLPADVEEGDLVSPDAELDTRAVVRPGLGLTFGLSPDVLRLRKAAR